MKLNDGIDFKGEFSITAIKKDGSKEVYVKDNLIMDGARENMAKLVGGVTNGDEGIQINKFVLGTKGHKGSNILDYKKVGKDGFDSTRTMIFSEEMQEEFYVIPFDVRGGIDVSVESDKCYNSKKTEKFEKCNVRRYVDGRICTFEITIGEDSANASSSNTSIIAYTEASLYAGDNIFSMKTFPARVKEDTVQFVIKWSIIF